MKVRWDSVVDGSRRFAPEHTPIPRGPAVGARRDGPVLVKVWLYGMLANDCGERPIALEVVGDCSVAAVIRELGRRLGEGFLRQVLDAAGRKFNHCLVFVDGVKVDTDAWLYRGTASAHVELILLTATEGG